MQFNCSGDAKELMSQTGRHTLVQEALSSQAELKVLVFEKLVELER